MAPAMILALAASRAAAEAPRAPQEVRQALAAKSEALFKAGRMTVRGQGNFFFLATELRHYGRGPFWGEHAAGASQAKENPDPLACLLDFHAQVKKAGGLLIVMFVPGKVAIYPDKLDPALAVDGRFDSAHQAFHELLRKDGIEVVDLVPDFLALRAKGVKSHCEQDTHWSPEAVRLAARKAAAVIQAQPWYAGVPKKSPKRAPETAEFTGDIVQLIESQGQAKLGLPPEDVTVEKVTLDGARVEGDPRSPVVLMGDSHTVVYHEPIGQGIEASDGGLVDHLAAELGFAPDWVANLGSGANAPRVTLARRRDNLAGKKCVVWCLSVRELTESSQGWQRVPVLRDAR
jgi:alginate O-acetyltransferase complex protein AlgJ